MFPLLGGCDQFKELLDLPNTEKDEAAAEAEAGAIGSACRQAGRSLEDCYLLNPDSRKSSVFTGWKEMNDYMQSNELPVVPSKMLQPGELPSWPRSAPGIPPLPSSVSDATTTPADQTPAAANTSEQK